MRAAGPALLVLALAAPAVAEPLGRPGMPSSRSRTDELIPIIATREAEEAAARQAEFNRRITERSNRAARSICHGCGPGARLGSTVTPPGLRHHRHDEAMMPLDPAQAPLD